MVYLALTEMRRIACDGYIFPEDYYDIPGVEDFQDLKAVKQYSLKKLERYRGEKVDVCLNGGMTVEILTMIQAAAELDIELTLCHYDREKENYAGQKVCWKPVHVRAEDEESPKTVVLCKGRHWSPAEKAVFDMIPAGRLFDFLWQEEQAGKFLREFRDRKLTIYLSGLTSAAVSVLNAARREWVSVTWLHYDYDKEDYFPQYMDE